MVKLFVKVEVVEEVEEVEVVEVVVWWRWMRCGVVEVETILPVGWPD